MLDEKKEEEENCNLNEEIRPVSGFTILNVLQKLSKEEEKSLGLCMPHLNIYLKTKNVM
jgi:hypothetical protein